MPSLQKRIEALEASEPAESPAFEAFIRSLPPLSESGSLDWKKAGPDFAEAFKPWLTELGKQCASGYPIADPVEAGLAHLIEAMTDGAWSNPFIFERYRGRVPERVLACVYDRMRNYSHSPEIRGRIWQLAGIADAAGNLLHGYSLDAQGNVRCSEPQPESDKLQ
jgi:hypothetical protein